MSIQNEGSERYLDVLPVDGVTDALGWFQARRLTLSIVSRIDFEPPWVPLRVHTWNTHHGIDQYIPKERVYFCEKWEEKRIFCQLIRPKFMVDDRLDVLVELLDIVEHLFLFRPTGEHPHLWHLVESGRVHWVVSWSEILDILTKQML